VKAAALLLLSFVLLSSARPGEEIQCNDGGTTLEMAACARDEFNAADEKLNAAYQLLLAAGAKEPTFIANLRNAQKAWIKFRDASLEARFACEDQDDRVCWGSMIQLDWPAYKTMLTRERAEQLNKLLAERYSAE